MIDFFRTKNADELNFFSNGSQPHRALTISCTKHQTPYVLAEFMPDNITSNIDHILMSEWRGIGVGNITQNPQSSHGSYMTTTTL